MSHPSPPIVRALIFDLDGTLLNTLEDLADSGNIVLEGLGLPQHPVDAYRYFVGLGVEELVRSMLPEESRDADTLARAVPALRDEYARRWKNKTRPYAGIAEMLSGLAAKGLPLCVLSNKPQGFTDLTVQEFFPEAPFTHVRGARPETPNKPHPAGALALAGELGTSPGSILFLGDSATDMRTARNAGMLPMGALWGFRTAEELTENGAVHLLVDPRDLLSLV